MEIEQQSNLMITKKRILEVPKAVSCRFRVGQYNILANYLAENLKPWFWYGYTGDPVGDRFDDLRKQTFGDGRSRLLISFYILLKKYFKCYAPVFNNELGHTEIYETSSPSIIMTQLLHKYLCDLFYRNNMNGKEGDYEIARHLFRSSSRDFSTWQAVTKSLGFLHLSEDQIQLLDQINNEIDQVSNNHKKREKIDEFNSHLRAFLSGFQSYESQVERCLTMRLFDLAQYVTLAESDLKRVLAVQRSWSWDIRGNYIAEKMLSMNCGVWCVQELDKVRDLQQKLKPRLKLAAFKHRKVIPKDDGIAIFYDPEMFDVLKSSNGRSCIGYLRMSGEYFASARERMKEVPKFSLANRKAYMKDGLIRTESTPLAELEGEEISFWGCNVCSEYTMHTRQYFDERVCLFVALKNKLTSEPVVMISTHLYHTQNDEFHEEVRAEQFNQINECLSQFYSEFSLPPTVTTILAADMNDVRNLACFNREGNSPLYKAILDHEWVDIFSSQKAMPTSLTLARSVNIDYILMRSSNCSANADPIEHLTLFDRGGNPCERSDAVFGIPQCQGDLIQPSDHCPIAAEFEMREPVKDA